MYMCHVVFRTVNGTVHNSPYEYVASTRSALCVVLQSQLFYRRLAAGVACMTTCHAWVHTPSTTVHQFVSIRAWVQVNCKQERTMSRAHTHFTYMHFNWKCSRDLLPILFITGESERSERTESNCAAAGCGCNWQFPGFAYPDTACASVQFYILKLCEPNYEHDAVATAKVLRIMKNTYCLVCFERITSNRNDKPVTYEMYVHNKRITCRLLSITRGFRCHVEYAILWVRESQFYARPTFQLYRFIIHNISLLNAEWTVLIMMTACTINTHQKRMLLE